VADVQVLYITPSFDVEVRTLDASDLSSFQEMVGGYVEAIYSDRFTAFINEEGRLNDLPPNALASVLAARYGWGQAAISPLVGNVVFMGPGATAEGDVLSVDDELISEAQLTAERMQA
jgi:hypothetical protein